MNEPSNIPEDISSEDVLFVNDFIAEINVLREINNLILFRNYAIYCYALCCAVIAICLWYDLPMIAIVLVVVILVIKQTAKHLNLKKLIKQIQVGIAANPEARKTEFLANQFNGGGASFRYERITKIVEGNLCLYIIIGGVYAGMVKKDAFTVGDYESFVIFLREKLKDNPKALKGLK